MNAVLLMTVMAMAPAAPLPKDAPLQWKLVKGDKFYTKSVQVMDQTMTVMGNDMVQEFEQTTFEMYEVKEASDKGYTIEQTTMKSTAKGNVPSFDDMAEKLKGAKLTFTFDEKFVVKKLEGYDKLMDKFKDASHEVKQLASTTIKEEGVKAQLTDLLAIMPDKVVKKGDKWKKESKLPLGPQGEFSLVSNVLFVESDKTDKLTYTGEGKYTLPKNPDPNLPFTFSKGDLKMDTYEGEINFDSKAGRLKSTTTNMKIAGTITVNANGMDIEIKIKQNIKVSTTVSDKNLADD